MSALLFDDLAYQLGPVRGAMRGAPMGHASVMAGRVEPSDSLDFFPTPPWVVRHFCAQAIPCLMMATGQSIVHCDRLTAWEPACGAGHMSRQMRSYFSRVTASDVADYGLPESRRGSFIAGEFGGVRHAAKEPPERGVDWIISNPPFGLGLEFAARALRIARRGVAFFVRLAWAESIKRWELHAAHPPTMLLNFADRVALAKARWDPELSSATAYTWIVWTRSGPDQPWGNGGRFPWWDTVPPGTRAQYELPDDASRFGGSFLCLDDVEGVIWA